MPKFITLLIGMDIHEKMRPEEKIGDPLFSGSFVG